MKEQIAALSIAAILAFGCSLKKEEGPPPAVLATVNGAPVTVPKFKERLRLLRLSFTDISGHSSSGADAKMDLLSQLIEEELYLQEARRLGIAVAASELDARMKREEAGYMGAFEKTLKQEDLSAGDYRGQLEEKLLVEKLLDSQVYSKVVIGPSEAYKYYLANKKEFRRPMTVRARQIVVANRKDAEEILAQLKKGADFATLARQRSLSPDAAAGGDLGYFGKGEMPPQFERAVFGLKPGRLSGVVKTPYGWHIFRVEAVTKAGEFGFSEVEAEITRKLKAEAAEEDFGKWQERLKSRAKITVDFVKLKTL